MYFKRPSVLVSTVLVLLVVTMQPLRVNAQYCPTVTTGGWPSVYTNAAGGMSVRKQLVNLFNSCALVPGTHAYCVPSIMGYTLLAYAMSSSTSPTPVCVWDCGICLVRIDSSDGLPVELMEFSVGE